ncbi:MAG: porin family protein [Epsilonproteobacteria bacterium]|jgi:opacity protein-like surface antigen|nr:porin family protein [Campylobacterota bacterium]
MKKLGAAIAVAIAAAMPIFAGKNVAPVPQEAPPIKIPSITPLGLYGGIGATWTKAECECDELEGSNGPIRRKVTNKMGGLNFIAGYEFNEYIGAEARVITNFYEDDGAKLTHYGVYLKPTMPVNDNLDLYGLVGYGHTTCDTHDLPNNGFAWGVGSEVFFGEKVNGKKRGVGLYAEYQRPIDKKEDATFKTHMINAGVKYHF